MDSRYSMVTSGATTLRMYNIKRRPTDKFVIFGVENRLDILANTYYGNSNYYWLILMANPKYNLPEQIRKFEASWVKNPNVVGATSFWGKYRQQKENYAFGRYKADLSLNYGTAGRVLTASTSFWVIPWHIILVNLIILVIIVVILYYLIKKYNEWLLKKYGKAQKRKK